MGSWEGTGMDRISRWETPPTSLRPPLPALQDAPYSKTGLFIPNPGATLMGNAKLQGSVTSFSHLLRWGRQQTGAEFGAGQPSPNWTMLPFLQRALPPSACTPFRNSTQHLQMPRAGNR